MQIVEAFTRRELPQRETPVKAVIVHSTGDNDLAKILKFYQDEDGLQPHYVIGLDGVIYHIVDERKIAYHCKIDKHEAVHYRLGWAHWSHWIWNGEQPIEHGQEFAGYIEWRDMWRHLGYQSPLDLITDDRPNGYSIGIELQQPTKPRANFIFTEAQYQSLADLVGDIGERHAIKLDRGTMLGHSDVSPMRRCNSSGSWDPGRSFNWNALCDLLRAADEEKRKAGMIK